MYLFVYLTDTFSCTHKSVQARVILLQSSAGGGEGGGVSTAGPAARDTPLVVSITLRESQSVRPPVSRRMTAIRTNGTDNSGVVCAND